MARMKSSKVIVKNVIEGLKEYEDEDEYGRGRGDFDISTGDLGAQFDADIYEDIDTAKKIIDEKRKLYKDGKLTKKEKELFIDLVKKVIDEKRK